MNDARPPSMTYAQVAAMLGKSVSTVEKWVHNGRIPFHRIGRNVRFNLAEIQQWLEENEITSDNRIQPVRPLKRRYGVQTVYPSDTLGDLDHCWCGEPKDHPWEGKETGAPHPHEHEGIQQVVIVDQQPKTDPALAGRIEKNDMRGYHAVLKSFLIKCINEDRLPWQRGGNSILIHPPDDTGPVTVYCRNDDSQMRALRQWYAAHVEPWKVEAGEVGEVLVAQLAEQVNDPAEHPVREADPVPEWSPYLTTDGEKSEFFESDGTTIRCKECLGTSHEWSTPATEVRGLGGHIRMMHRDTEGLRTPEAVAKSVDSRRYNRLHAQVSAAVELLAESVGIDTNGDQRRVAELEQDLAKQTKRADEAEARLRLMQEAFEGLK